MKINAMPGCGGNARNKLLNASNPPADAPMATIGKLVPVPVSEAGLAATRTWRRVVFFFVERGINCAFARSGTV